MITLTLLHLHELNPLQHNTERRCGQPRPWNRRGKERESCMLQAPGCRRRADPREQPCACSPMMMIDAGRTHTPQPLSKIKSLFCKVVKEQNGTGLRQPPHPSSLLSPLTAGVPFSVFSIIYSSGSRQRDCYTPFTQAHECAQTDTRTQPPIYALKTGACLLDECFHVCACVSGCLKDHRDTASHENI